MGKQIGSAFAQIIGIKSKDLQQRAIWSYFDRPGCWMAHVSTYLCIAECTCSVISTFTRVFINIYIATIRCFVEQRVAVRHCRAIGVRSISNHTTYWIKYDNHFHTHTYCPFYLMSRRVHGEWVAINFMGNRFLNGDTWPMYVCNVKVFKHRQCRWTTKQWLQNYLFYE